MASETADGRKVEWGIFDWVEWDQNSPAQIFEDRLSLLEYADKQDFYCYHMAEHHTTPLSVAPSPGMFLSAVAQRTSRIRLGPLVYLLPLYNPLRLIQEVCMLDHLSKGRLELGVGRGIVPYEVARFGVDPEKGRAIFDEALVVLLKGLNNETLNHEGEFYNYKDIRLWIKPFQQPHPPIWYASGNIETVPWMAKNGINTSHIFDTNAVVKKHFDLYQEIWQEHQNDPDRINTAIQAPKQGQTRHVYIAPTDAEAIEEARSAWKAWCDNINYLWNLGNSDNLKWLYDFDTLLADGKIVAGSPQTVKEKVWQAIEESGINYFISVFAWGNIPYEKVRRAMEYFVDEVMPSPK
ncbi:MAG TPA: LLM class flavin-dependent oxidoreductase [Dehalococcoidia bacterium]|nr:LLM class flavin-dependent oxidoreductase [Dehalococcoidia bacterium]HIL32577.1 LLM class flavin-dependent oxidoreductase [Dehalococcoidia bacterium]